MAETTCDPPYDTKRKGHPGHGQKPQVIPMFMMH